MRPSKLQWAMELAQVTAKRSTCLRRQVGCVLLNARGHVLATGYNGVAAGMPHCSDNHLEIAKALVPDSTCMILPHGQYPNACPGAQSPSGTNLDGCQAIHAEQNALLQCRDVYEIDTCVAIVSPCLTCMKLLLNTGCRRIVFLEEYPHPEAGELWRRVRGETYGGKDHHDVTPTWFKL